MEQLLVLIESVSPGVPSKTLHPLRREPAAHIRRLFPVRSAAQGFWKAEKCRSASKDVGCRKSVCSDCTPRVAHVPGFWHSPIPLTMEGCGCYSNDGGMNRVEARASTSHVRWQIGWLMDEGVDVVCAAFLFFFFFHFSVCSCGVKKGCWIWQMD